MYISLVYIEEFGGIKNYKMEFAKGLNLIVGENEAGKSTICEFIKFVFFGHDKSERERYSNFLSKLSAGYIEIEKDGEIYVIDRRESVNSRNSSCKVISKKSGEIFKDWEVCKTPGEYFLGVSKELYTKSLYVSQLSGSKLDKGSADAISNLLLSADETSSVTRAKKKLNEVRRDYKLKSGKAGYIAAAEDRLSQLKGEFAKSTEIKEKTERYDFEIKTLIKEAEDKRKELQKTKELLALKNASEIRKYRILNESAKIKHQVVLDKMAEISETAAKNGLKIDSESLTKVHTLEVEKDMLNQNCIKYREGIENISIEKPGKMPIGYGIYKEKGRENLQEENSRLKNLTLIFKILFIFSGAVALCGAVAFILTLLEVLDGDSSSFVGFGISAFIMIISAFLFLKFNKNRKDLLTSLGADETNPVEKIFALCDEYSEKLQSHSINAGYAAKIQNQLDEETKKLQFKTKEQADFLELLGYATAEEVKNAHTELKKLREERKILEEEMHKSENLLSRFDEEERRNAMVYTDSELEQGEKADVSREKAENLENEIDELDNRISETRIRLAELGANTSRDIADITAEIEEVKERLDGLNENYEALILAQDMLESAEDSIRMNVSPKLCNYASKCFEKMTSGRYGRLILNPDLHLNYAKNDEMAMDGMYMSMGSSELAWICLRFALHKKICSGGNVPVILDEALVYFDNTRLEGILKFVKEFAESGVQIIIFSASDREKRILGENAYINEMFYAKK